MSRRRIEGRPTEVARQSSKASRLAWWMALAAAVHFVVASHAASTKSATFDEPVHALAGALQWRYTDFRLNPEHPPLWKHLSGLATSNLPLTIDLDHPDALTVFANVHTQEKWAINTLFRSSHSHSHSHSHGVQFLDRARRPMPIFGALVVVLVGCWAGSIGGQKAGVVAAWLAAIDPNLLAHSGLVTNDVACTASLLACFYFASRLIVQATYVNISFFCVACGVAACIKYTCLALPLFLAPVAVLRLFDLSQWKLPAERSANSLLSRLWLILAVILVAAMFAYGSIWAAYGFRYLPTPKNSLKFDVDFPEKLFGWNALSRKRQDAMARGEQPPELLDVAPGRLQTFCQMAHRHQLLPQAFLQGLAYANAMSSVSQSYIDGKRTVGGTLSYFPRAWIYKTPLAIILGAVLALGWSVGWLKRRGWTCERAVLALVLPYSIVILLAISYDMNIGLRHVLPAFPLMWIGLGVVGGRLLEMASPMRYGVTALISLAVIESLSAHPNYIAFFNLAASGQNQGLERLSDSNLDWGQDLKQLARWQSQNGDLPLYLSYFGSADPAAYGVNYINTPPGYIYGSTTVVPNFSQPGYLAYSATWLQGAYIPEGPLRIEVDMLRQKATPKAVLGGTIYIYELPLQIQRQP